MNGLSDRRGEHDAAISHKKHFVTREDGTREERSFTYFGFKLHLTVDIPTQLPVAFFLTQGLEADSPKLIPMLEDFKLHHPVLCKTTLTLAADMGYDDEKSITKAREEFGILLLSPTQKMWKNYDQLAYHPDTH